MVRRVAPGAGDKLEVRGDSLYEEPELSSTRPEMASAA